MKKSFLPTLIAFSLVATAGPTAWAAQMGSLDPAFTTSTDGPVNVYSPQANGKIYIGGGFTTVNGRSSRGIARLNSDGTVDTAFNVGTGADQPVVAIATQSAGQVLVSGSFTNFNGIPRNYFTRLRPDGSVDLLFFPQIFDFISDIIVLPNDSILVSGDFQSVNDIPRNRIARLTPNGGLDSTFNVTPGPDSTVVDMTLLPDGKIFISGLFTNVSNFPRNGMARLNADGTVDTAFTPPQTDGQIAGYFLDPSGKVYIGGDFTLVSGVPRQFLARLNADGSLDPNFDPGLTINGPVLAMSGETNGSVFIGGWFTAVSGVPRSGIARLKSDGELDLTFDPGTGFQGDPAVPPVTMLRRLAGDKLLVTGSFTNYNGTPRGNMAQIFAEGTPAGGTTTPPIVATPSNAPTTDGLVNVFQPQADGKILLGGGFSTVNNTPRGRIARLNADGSLDPSFNIGAGASQDVVAIATQSDGKILVSGLFTNINGVPRNYFTRLRTDGTVDLRFFPQIFDFISDIIVLPDDRILVSGDFQSINDIPRNRIARLMPYGHLDPTFSVSPGPDSTVLDMTLLPDGKIFITGLFTNVSNLPRNGMARLNADGTVDASFNPPQTDGQIVGYFIEPSGKVYIGGDFTRIGPFQRQYLARLNTDGSLDPAFDPGFTINGPVTAVTGQPDGNVFIGGWFTAVSGVPRAGIARLLSNGELDLTFNPGTGLQGDPALPPVSMLRMLSATNLLIAGTFTSYNGVPRGNIVQVSITGASSTPTNDVNTVTLMNPRRVGNTFSLDVQTVSGPSYFLEIRQGWTPEGPWVAIAQAIGDGRPVTFSDPAATGPVRYYRVRKQ